MAEGILPANYWADWVKNNPEKAAENRAAYNARIAKGRTAPKRRKGPSSQEALLRSPEWRALRLLVLAKYGAVCMCCGSKKNIQVDHIKAKSKYPELALEFNNLQVLCWDCNKFKAARHERDFRKSKQFSLMMA